MTRFLWPLLLLLIALVATSAQLDRQSRYHPELAAQVPPAFRSFAAFHLARDVSDDAQALHRARLLVARRPLPAEHLSLLASAQLRRVPQWRGLLTIQQAARRGWRDLPAQHAMLGFALKAGDSQEAAARLAALLVLETNERALAPTARIALEPADVRQEFAQILASNPNWQTPVIVRLSRLAPAPVIADILERADAAGALFDCPKLRGAMPSGADQIMPRACQ